MSELLELGYFDAAEGVDQTQRNLPHWFQPNVIVFVTFRTADSMPKEIVRRWQEEQRAWLRDHDWPLDANAALPHWQELPAALRGEFHKQRSSRWHWHLDSCHGKCELRNRDLANIIIGSLRHFDGQRYDLDCAIIMPNHVHLLVQFHPEVTCRAQCASWLHYTAWQINKKLGRKGAFWQSEPFDHLVRSPEQMEFLQHYIAENGMRANLPETDYLFWRRS